MRGRWTDAVLPATSQAWRVAEWKGWFLMLLLMLLVGGDVRAQTAPDGVARVRARIGQIGGQATSPQVVIPIYYPAQTGDGADLTALLRRLAILESLLRYGLGTRLSAPIFVLPDADSLDAQRLAALLDSLYATPDALPEPTAGGLTRADLVAVMDSLLALRLAGPPAGAPETRVIERALLETGLFRAATVIFEFDRSVLLPASFPTLEAVGEVLVKYPDLQIEVGGHTDSIGSAAYNLTLSAARAAAVRAYLLEHFPLLAPERITAQGYGEHQPIADNRSETGRALNRRVEFVVRRAP